MIWSAWWATIAIALEQTCPDFHCASRQLSIIVPTLGCPVRHENSHCLKEIENKVMRTTFSRIFTSRVADRVYQSGAFPRYLEGGKKAKDIFVLLRQKQKTHALADVSYSLWRPRGRWWCILWVPTSWELVEPFAVLSPLALLQILNLFWLKIPIFLMETVW